MKTETKTYTVELTEHEVKVTLIAYGVMTLDDGFFKDNPVKTFISIGDAVMSFCIQVGLTPENVKGSPFEKEMRALISALGIRKDEYATEIKQAIADEKTSDPKEHV
jgi:hypothetical protein